jgi:hypothetical protein
MDGPKRPRHIPIRQGRVRGPQRVCGGPAAHELCDLPRLSPGPQRTRPAVPTVASAGGVFVTKVTKTGPFTGGEAVVILARSVDSPTGRGQARSPAGGSVRGRRSGPGTDQGESADGAREDPLRRLARMIPTVPIGPHTKRRSRGFWWSSEGGVGLHIGQGGRTERAPELSTGGSDDLLERGAGPS